LRRLCFIVFSTLLLFLLVSFFASNVLLWRVWSFLGDEEFYLALSLLIYYLHPDPVGGLLLVLSVVFSGSFNVFLKYWLNLPRPLNPLVPVEGPGFPSGHSQVSTSFWFVFPSVICVRCFYLVSIVLITGISLSRLYLRAHYPVDVVCGVVFGLIVGLVVLLLKSFLGYLVFILCSILSLMLSLISVLLFGGPISTCSVLIATSLVVFLLLLFFRGYLKSIVFNVWLRLFLFIVSSGIVFLVYFLTLGFGLFLRVFVFSLVVFFVLMLPLFINVFCVVKCR